MTDLKIKIIGIGGVGTVVAEKISQFCSFLKEYTSEIYLIDGDKVEEKNRRRQIFNDYSGYYKSDLKVEELSIKFPENSYYSVPTYVNEENIHTIIEESDVVLMCVDNHPSRSIVDSYVQRLENITLISGGNEFIDGNVQIYVKRKGNDITPPISEGHPEIRNPTKTDQEEMGCAELVEEDPQLSFTNMMTACFMCSSFYNVIVESNYKWSEVCFDISKLKAVPFERNTKRR